MSSSAQPVADLSPLPKADGSATFSYGGYTVTAAVNGPIEAQRRDENAFEALVDVNVRPAAGVGGSCFPVVAIPVLHDLGQAHSRLRILTSSTGSELSCTELN